MRYDYYSSSFHPFLQTQDSEWERENFSKENSQYIINKNRLHYEATYFGQREAILHRTNYIQKTPILLSESQELIIIPTHSPEHMDCILFMLYQICKVSQE
ncbi:competence protein ComK [Sutcliffiella cohnii]